MLNFGRFSKNRMERALVSISLVGFLLTGAILVSEDLYQFFLGLTADTSSAPVIGRMDQAEKDVRARSAQNSVWLTARSGRDIRIGDSIFTGANSSAEILLANGDRVILNENSLVRFLSLDKIEVPNIALGNFRMTVGRSMKVALGDQVAEIFGRGSEIQFAFDEKTKIKALKGEVEVRTKSSSQILAAALPGSDSGLQVKRNSAEMDLSGAQPFQPALSQKALAKIDPVNEPLVYTEEVFDHFEERGDELVPRTKPRRLVNLPVRVSWRLQENPEQVFGQLSSDKRFTVVPATFTAPASQRQGLFPRAFTGTNYVRLSSDGKTWAEPIEMNVVSRPLPDEGLNLRFKSEQLFILYDAVEVEGEILSQLNKFIVEMSERPDFPADVTRIGWKTEKKFQFLVSQPKTLFMRVRGVDGNLKMTAPSRTVRIDVSRPGLPEAPRLSSRDLQVREGEMVQLRWPAAAYARNYRVKVLSAQGDVITEDVLATGSLSFQAPPAGDYRIEVVTRDGFGRSSRDLAEARLVVVANPPTVPPTLAEEPQREVAAVQKSTMETGKIPTYLNRNFVSSKLSLEGAAFTSFSLDQLDQDRDYPTPATLGVRSLTWFGSYGAEGVIKTKVMDLFNTAKGDSSPLVVEARAHRRWPFLINPFSSLQKAQISVIGGYEYYRNYGHGLFAPKYDLFKAGFSLAFPMWNRFDTGGEVLYGFGVGGNQKYEIAGYINYYYQRRWSLGVGYRVHLFQAGTTESSPLGLPYREGFGEGNSVIRWHY